MSKKEIRDKFRNDCFKRDKFRCRMCGFAPPSEAWDAYKKGEAESPLDCHHICDRSFMPFGGYVSANGISVCPTCHGFAEQYHITGIPHPGYSPYDLYTKIGESYDVAVQRSFGLDPDDETARSLKWWNRVRAICVIERHLLPTLGEFDPSTVSWELACEQANEVEPMILLYGKGRYC